MACDVCGKTGTELVPLLETYRTPEIAAICPECRNVVDSQLRKIRSMTHRILSALIKRFMVERKAKL